MAGAGNAWADGSVTPVSFNYSDNVGKTDGTISFDSLSNSASGSITAQTYSSSSNSIYYIKLSGSASRQNCGYWVMKYECSVPSYARVHATTGKLYINLMNPQYKTDTVACLSALYEFDSLTEAQSASVSIDPSAINAYASGTDVPYSSHLIRYAYNSGAKQSVTSSNSSYTTAFDNSNGSTDSSIDKYWLYTTCSGFGQRSQASYLYVYPYSSSVFCRAVSYDYYKHITFDANGGSGSMADQVIENSGVLAENAFRSQGDFNGWNTKADGTGTAYAPGDTITATSTDKGPVTLYAQWKAHTFVNHPDKEECDVCHHHFFYYTSTDGKTVWPVDTLAFKDADGQDLPLYGNFYDDGQGAMEFLSPLAEIGAYAFRGCSSLTSLIIPGSVTSIGALAFDGCSSLTNVTDYALRPQAIDSNTFSRCDTLHVVCRYGYAMAEGWKNFSVIVEDLPSPNNVIFYSSTDGLITPNKTNVFGANIVSNTCEDGFGIITFDGEVTSIGANAFDGCSTLSGITIPNSVTTIGTYAFNGCSSLTEINIPESVSSIAIKTVRGCANLAHITVAEGNSHYDSRDGCDAIIETATNKLISGCQNSFIPNTVTSLDEGAFDYCVNLKNIVIPSSVTSIGGSAFYGCSSLSKVTNFATTPQSLNSVFSTADTLLICGDCDHAYRAAGGWKSFKNIVDLSCIHYTTEDGEKVTPYQSESSDSGIIIHTYENGQGRIVFDQAITTIGDSVFLNCANLTSATIFATGIGASAFEGCTGLTEITIPNSVTDIGDNAFAGCSALRKVANFAGTPQVIASSTFSTKDTLYVLPTRGGRYSAAEGWKDFVTIIEEVPSDIICYLSSDGKTVTPNNSGVFGASILSNTYEDGLGIIVFGGEVTKVGVEAFRYCSKLTHVFLPESVTELGRFAFKSCNGLIRFELPESVDSIGNWALGDCNALDSISVAPGNSRYDSRDNCNAIIETATNKLIAGCHSTIIPNTVTSIGDAAFDCCSSLKNIKIPESVTSIHWAAFWGCGLSSVTIPASVDSIWLHSFVLNNLKTITVLSPTLPVYVLDYSHDNITNSFTIDTLYTLPDCVQKYHLAIVDYDKNYSPKFYVRGAIKPKENPQYIFYTSTDGKIVTPANEDAFGAAIISNTYAKGYGVLVFDGDVTSIGESAFQGCQTITGMMLSNSVTSIGASAFAGCSSLRNFTIPASVDSIGENAFQGCNSLTGITSLSPVPLDIMSNVFSRKDTLYVLAGHVDAYRSAEVWKDFKVIEEHPQYLGYTTSDNKALNATHVQCINVNVYTDKIGIAKFYSSSTSLPAAFGSDLTSVNIPKCFTEIGKNAFDGCSKLPNVTIPNSVTSIATYAFNGCSSLTEINIPESVSSIAIKTVRYCENLASITVAEGNSHYDSRNGCNAIIETATNKLISGCRNTVIPNTVTSLDEGAFDYCINLQNIDIPSSVSSIGKYAFCHCTSLTAMTIPSTVTSISEYAFKDCSNLTDITNLSPCPQSISSNTFTVKETLHVPQGCGGLYRAAEGWKEFSNIVEDIPIPQNVIVCSSDSSQIIPFNAAAFGANLLENTYNNGVSLITFDGNVTEIGDSAFRDCSELTSVLYPNSVTSIGASAFSGCSNLIAVSLPDSVTSIENNTFAGCSSLTSVEIPGSVTLIGDEAFKSCSSLTDIVVPNSVASIGSKAFYGCSNLASVSLPDSLKCIETGTFQNCIRLGSVEIPGSVTCINSGAFYGCALLKSLTIPNSVSSIGQGAFAQCQHLETMMMNSIPECFSQTFLTSYAYNTIPDIHLSLSDSSYVCTTENRYFPALASAPTYTRSGIRNQWGTIVLPFALSLDGTESFDLYSVSDANEEVLNLCKVTELAAGTPALFRMRASAKDSATGLYNLTMTAATDSVKATGTLTDGGHDGLTLQGTFAPLTLTDQSGYIISSNAFWNIQTLHSQYPDSRIGVGAFRAYLSGNLTDGAAQLHIGFDAAAALETIEALTSGRAEFYDLSGRRQESLRPGVNIIRHGNKSVKVIIK